MKDNIMTVQEEYFKNLSDILKKNFKKKGFAFNSFSNKEEAKKAQNGTRAIFTKCTCSSSIPNVKISKNDFSSSKISIFSSRVSTFLSATWADGSVFKTTPV